MASQTQIKSRFLARTIALVCMIAVSGCATAPRGPSALALPGTGKSFETFQVDDGSCRGYAFAQTGGVDANQAATDSAVRSAALGTAIGAVAGAAIGGHRGVGAGAGTGLLFGTMAGAGAGEASARGSQRSFDNAYVQCMYAKGHQVPIVGDVRASQRRLVVQDAPYLSSPYMAPGYSSQPPFTTLPPPPTLDSMPFPPAAPVVPR